MCHIMRFVHWPDGEGHIMLLKEKFTIALPVCPGGELLKNAPAAHFQ